MCPVKEATKLLAKEVLNIRNCTAPDLNAASYIIFKNQLEEKKRLCQIV